LSEVDLAAVLQGSHDPALPVDRSVVELRARRQAPASHSPTTTRSRAWWQPDRLLAAAAAIVLLVVGVVIGSFIAGGTSGTDSIHGPAAGLILTGERFSTTDRTTGVTSVVGLESRKWGTHVALELRGVRGPLRCQLIAVSRDGTREVAMSWDVPRAGYGVPGSPDPLVIHGATSLSRDELARVEVRTTDGERLVMVPIS